MDPKIWRMIQAWQKLNCVIYYADGELHMDAKKVPDSLLELRVAATYAASGKDDYEATKKAVHKMMRRDRRMP